MLMNWSNIVPSDVAKLQEAWERRAKVLRMRELGFTLDAIARRLGVTRERVRQMEAGAKRTREMSPVEQYSRDFREVAPLADAIVKRAKARGKLAGPRLIRAAEEALEIARGNMEPARLHMPKEDMA